MFSYHRSEFLPISVQGVPEAYVPVKVVISGIPLDFLMARLALSSLAVPQNLSLKDDNLLRNLDDRCVRSLIGMCDFGVFIMVLNHILI